ncbi:MAG: mannose-1-phosphate guanylyltransferase/mannose-6-phosphate isomerase [Gammaproteobacteria bacterium]
MKILPVILAGGGGTRLWPLSRSHYPKQFLAVNGDDTLLQGTVTRLAIDDTKAKNLAVDAPMIVCNEEHRFLVGEQARQAKQKLATIVLEPVGRNTAPALTAAALLAMRDGDDPLLLMMPADHLIQDKFAFNLAVAKGAQIAAEGNLVTFGIVPTAAETGYGYIQLGELFGEQKPTSHTIAAFKEKPDLETAEKYVASGEYRWNAGIFLMKASVWLSAIKRYQPEIAAKVGAAVDNGQVDGEFFRLERDDFEKSPSDSIDYAVMERIVADDPTQGAVVSLDAGWSDVGSWSSIWEVAEKDAQGNVTRGDVRAEDSKNNVIIGEHRLVTALGCEDMVIVETPDAVLVARKDRAQDVKKLVDWLGEQERDERLFHRRVYRPWGSYEGVDAGERFQVKRIIVNPGASLSLQMHHHRAEHWIVVNGTATVTCGDKEFLLSENESTYIPIGATHRLENPGSIPLELIEVQSGSYLGEDDIVRFKDNYNRA